MAVERNHPEKRVLNIRGAFIAAERYRAASEGLKGANSDPDFFVPRIVLAAIAIELYLKVLLVIETGGMLRSHRYHDLFNALPLSTQGELTEVFENEKRNDSFQRTLHLMESRVGRPIDVSIEHCLEASGEAFVKWRYNFEGDLPQFLCPFELIAAVRSIILDRYPELPQKPSTGDRMIVIVVD